MKELKQRQVSLNGKLTYDDYGMIQTKKEITPPKPKTTYLSVPGRDGDLDLSESLDEIHYEDRTILLSYFIDGKYDRRLETISRFVNAYNGQSVTLIDVDDTPSWYYKGRAIITELVNLNAYSTLEMELRCDPFMYARYPKRKSISVITADSRKTMQVLNAGFRKITPTIISTGNAVVSANGVSVTVTYGTYQASALTLLPGLNVVGVEGDATITLSYAEVML